jgi:hypothetical protein
MGNRKPGSRKGARLAKKIFFWKACPYVCVKIWIVRGGIPPASWLRIIEILWTVLLTVNNLLQQPICSNFGAYCAFPPKNCLSYFEMRQSNLNHAHILDFMVTRSKHICKASPTQGYFRG